MNWYDTDLNLQEDMKIIDEINEEMLRSRMEDDSGSESESDSDDRGGIVEVIMKSKSCLMF